jgi:hypothetical protein
MKAVTFSVLILIGVLFMSANLKGQIPSSNQAYIRAAQELESVLSGADKLDSPLAAVKVKAKAANLLWQQNPDKARTIFLKLWDFIDEQKDKPFDQDEARIAVLKYLFVRDKSLADQLLQKLSRKSKSENAFDFDRLSGTDAESKRLALLANNLAEGDVTLAAALIEENLSNGFSPRFTLTLSKIREQNLILANSIAARAMESLKAQPNTTALVGIAAIGDYLYPITPAPPPTSQEEIASDESLNAQFMNVGYSILKDSLVESDDALIKDKQLTRQSFTFRAVCQGVLAATLDALAIRYAPQLSAELDAVSKRLISALPQGFVNIALLKTATIRGNAATNKDEPSSADISGAFARGDFDEAQEMIDKLKDEKSRKAWSQNLLKIKCKSLLAKSALLEALNVARKIESPTVRMNLLAEIAAAAHKKHDENLSTEILNEARRTPADELAKGVHARVLLSLAAESAYFAPTEAMLMLQDAVAEINSLNSADKDAAHQSNNAALSYLNDPNGFVDSAEMRNAFAALSAVNFDEALSTAQRLENKSAQMAARLNTIEKTLGEGKQDVMSKSKTSPKNKSKSK